MRQRLILVFGLILSACAQDDDAARFVDTTAAENADDVSGSAAIGAVEPTVEVIAEELAYGATDDHNLNGYLVLPADAVEVPGVIMIHEWWGLNDNVRAMARRLAGEGYAVLALDFFGGETATTAAEADSLMSEVMGDREGVLNNIRQAHGYLDRFVLAPRIATLGWGLGGAWSLEAGIDLGNGVDAVVMYYGRIVNNDNLLATLDAPVLGIFAENDQSIPVREALRFRTRLRDLGRNFEVLIYSDVAHAFANPNGIAYDHAAAEEAWAETLAFLDQRLR